MLQSAAAALLLLLIILLARQLFLFSERADPFSIQHDRHSYTLVFPLFQP